MEKAEDRGDSSGLLLCAWYINYAKKIFYKCE